MKSTPCVGIVIVWIFAKVLIQGFEPGQHLFIVKFPIDVVVTSIDEAVYMTQYRIIIRDARRDCIQYEVELVAAAVGVYVLN